MYMIKVLLADDQELIRESLGFVLGAQDDITVVGMAKNGREAIELVRSEKPDVVLMDIRMPEVDGVECTRLIKSAHPNIKVIVLTTFDDDEYVFNALRFGAPPATDKSFLKKSTVRQTVHIIILCNWLPFYRPYSFASQTFVCFANYFLLQLSQRGNFITSQYLTMCEQNFTTLIYEKAKKENNRYIYV